MFKIQTLFILFISFLFVTDLSFAANANEMMQNANKFYRSGDYENAIERYKELTEQGYEGVSLFFNLGNSYYRIGKIGYAILNYERALKISPSDEDVQHNLSFAYLSTIDRIQPLPEFYLFEIWESVLATFSVNGWSYFAYFIYILLLALIVLYFFVKTISQQKIILFSGLAILFVFPNPVNAAFAFLVFLLISNL